VWLIIGIVGENVLAEQAATNNKITAKPLVKLGFSKCKLAFAKTIKFEVKVSQK
jgi:ATP phosphoribosyltransferase